MVVRSAGRDGSPRRARQLRAHGLVASACVPVFFDPESYAIVEAACERLIPAGGGTPRRHGARRRRLHRRAARRLRRRPAPDLGGRAVLGPARRRGVVRHVPARSRALEELAWRTRIEGSQGIAEREFNGPVAGWQQRVPRRDRRARPRLRHARRRRAGRAPRRRAGVQAAAVRARVRGRVRRARVRRQPRPRAAGEAIGFPGDVQPRGYTDDEVTGRD